ncbi:uncharacterized protein LOC142622066 [Castanea sativa]|uniref:uncharacterized protein LOC142622066 n=1 Tax=Castanea sativa TaxID=21020 RepID=UPI003F64F0B0
MGFSATNNEAEYEALLIGMTMVQKMGGKNVEMFSDSRLVVGQVEGELEARDLRMQEYLSQVRRLQSNFESFTLVKISRNRNTHANSLATLATSSAQSLPWVILVEDLHTPTKINVDVVRVHQIKVGPSWMDHIVLYLKENILPEEKSEADKQHSCFWKNCMRGFVEVIQEENLYLIEPLLKDIGGLICRRKRWRGVLNPLSSPWPFAQWGLDIARPFLKAVGNKRFLLVGTDYFTKWVEAEPLSNIRDLDARRFVWKNIVTQFRIPHTLISDNGVHFDSKTFRRYCCDLVIPLETGFPTLRLSSFSSSNNNGLLEKSLDLVEELRETAMVQLTYYQHKLKQGYDSNVKLRPLTPGDLVLRKVLDTTKNPAWENYGQTGKSHIASPQ